MQKCIQSALITDVKGPKEGFATIKKAGFDAVDYNIDLLFTRNEMLSGKPSENFKDENLIPFMTEIRNAAQENGIAFGQMHAPFPTWMDGETEINENIFATIVKSIEMCAFCGCPRLIIHPAFIPGARAPMSKKCVHETNVKFYSVLIPYLKKYNVIGCLENLFLRDYEKKRIYAGACSDIHDTNALLDELNDIAGERRFGFCLDTGHLNLIGADQYEFITALGDRLETLHIQDNHGTEDEHLAPYMGNIIWERFFEGLRAINYRGNLSFETFGAVRIYPPEMAESVLNLLGDTAEYFKRRVTE
ncbi:MAG TPA: sugar phosphate isomerase/epimerase family protein [Oscillospiraceae bacterium]|nr:sugar phosphate isomerase/epimerase family protein [Oscillospiraceae bacterium]HPF54978.1 sugar phosphate isomerase/epimerase family protein [Clostridiales bacterium]HPK34391.1 sugar phosphate isomerase/epimerase family protein [Oscillospiraceae bacterium]HPR76735.1 sugar phosphate isomerase/epimerase family protein [Oscillospiraceae bacterium]